MEKIERLREIIERSHATVFFGGAGVSTESGIPDFRSVDGLYHQKYQYPPETILSHTFFMKRPEEFFRFYWDKMIYPQAEPNATHNTLAGLEQEGKLTAVITQNIDGLHQKAGSHNVLELHGSVLRNYCMKCHRFYSLPEMQERACGGVPHCECGGIIKPDVVLYEESLDEMVLSRSIEAIENAEVMIVGGTSLSVYPAAGLLRYFRGSQLILINKSITPYDDQADLVFHQGLGEVLGNLFV